ncbi:MAG: FAD-dependent oxidoreductase, partial [Alphaproteobacteria bacterium]
MGGTDIPTRTTRRPVDSIKTFQCDICVVGSGAAGLSAALEAARAGKRVILVESAQSLGG